MKKFFAVISSLVILLTLFTACGSKASDGLNNSFGYTGEVTAGGSFGMNGGWDVEEDVVYDEAPMEPEIAPGAPGAVSPGVPDPGMNTGSADADKLPQSERKIIKNKNLTVETLEFDAFISKLTEKIQSFGGYVQDSTQHGNSYGAKGLKSASYTIRIPAERFDEFTDEIGSLATVTYTYEYIDDVTSNYIDIEARLSALEAERDGYMKLMEKAATVEEILQIQSYLSNVNYQIESYTSQLNTYKSLISYSTLRLEINEVERITPVAEKPGVFERIKLNLADNLYEIGEGFKDMFVGIASSLPYLVIFAVIIVIFALIIRAVIKKASKPRAEVKNIPAENKDDEK